MSGLDKILQTIDSQSQYQAEAIESEAKRQAAEICTQGEIRAKGAYAQQMEAQKRTCDRAYKNACAAADASMRRELLACRVACIEETIEEALQRAAELEDKAYFQVILRLIRQHLQKGQGTLSFSAADLDRLPADFADRLSQLDPASTFDISPEPADIENGFVLCYGRISENCSFRAIAEAEKNRIRDCAAAVLFEE